MELNLKPTMLCSIDKMVRRYSRSGLGRTKDVFLLNIIHSTLSVLNDTLSFERRKKLEHLAMILSEASSDICDYTSSVKYEYGISNDCINPTFTSTGQYNHGPSIDDPNPYFM